MVLVGLVALGTFAAFRTSDPRLEGRPTRDWVRDLSSGDPKVQRAAQEVFRRHRDVAGDELAHMVRPGWTGVIRRLRVLQPGAWLPSRWVSWVRERVLRRELDQIQAVRMCRALGSNSDAVGLSLERALADARPFARSEAARTLGSLGWRPERALPKLAGLLSDPEVGVRSGAAQGMALYGAAAAPWRDRLVALTNDAQPGVAFSCRLALAALDTPDRVIRTTNEFGEIQLRLDR